MRKKKKGLSRKEKNKMVKEAMWRKACRGNISATKIYLEMNEKEMEEKSRRLTPEEARKRNEEIISKMPKGFNEVINEKHIQELVRDSKTRKIVRKELKKYKDKD